MKIILYMVVLYFLLISFAVAGNKYASGFGKVLNTAHYGNNNPEGNNPTQGFSYWGDVSFPVRTSGDSVATFHTGSTLSVPTYFSQVRYDSLHIPSGTAVYGLVWVYIKSGSELPLTNQYICALETFPTGKDLEIYWTTGDKLALARQGTIQATTTGTTPKNKYFPILYMAGNKTSGNRDTLKVWGETLTDTLPWSANNIEHVYQGFGSNDGSGVNHGATYAADDWIVNDGAGSYMNSWPDTNSHVIELFVNADSSIGGWLTGSGGSSNLYDAMNDVPTGGVASGSETSTSNIQNTSTNTADNAFFTTQAYNTKVPSGATVLAVFASIRTGEDVASGQEWVAARCYTNPTDTTEAWHSVGDNLGAHTLDYYGGDPVLNDTWVTHFTQRVNSPTLDLTKGATLMLGRRTSGTAGKKLCADQFTATVIYTTTAQAGSGGTQLHIGRKH